VQTRDRQGNNPFPFVAIPDQQCTAPPMLKHRPCEAGALHCIRDTSQASTKLGSG
jgi:hypothetical protein